MDEFEWGDPHDGAEYFTIHDETGICMASATDEELLEVSSYDPTEPGKILRVSKSSFMSYLYCARKYYWEKVALKDLRMPATELMIRGGDIHKGYEDLNENWEGQHSLRSLLPQDFDEPAYDSLAELEEQRLEAWGIEYFKPIEAEVKRVYYDAKNDVVIVGLLDGLARHPDGGLCIMELKTGTFNDGKISRTRRELCFYRKVLMDMGITEPITHFCYIGPDANNQKFIDSMLKSPSKEVWVGSECGITIVEKVNKRSVTSFETTFDEFLVNIHGEEWPMSWDDWMCPQWCAFCASCEAEITGIDVEW